MMHGHGGTHGFGHGMKNGFGPHGHGKVLGTTTIGERGQVVIPAEARETLKIEAGDKFVVFGDKRGNAVTLVKADVISKFAEIFMGRSEKYEAMAQDILSQINEDEDSEDTDTATDASKDAPKEDAPESPATDGPEA